jgi:DNA polymerase-1
MDGDIFAFRASVVVQKCYEWGNTRSVVSDPEEAESKYDADVAAVVRALKPTRVVHCFTSGVNFRKKINPNYKANRQGKDKPLQLSHLIKRQFATAPQDCYRIEGLEADDILGILATHPTLIPGRKIVVSIDKDMQTFPGLHYNPDKPGVLKVSQQAADWKFWMQILTGDPVDGYSGLPGIGPIKAEAILCNPDLPLWPAIVAAYEKKGLTEDDALLMARMARILQHTDFDFKTSQPILWTPSAHLKEFA